MKAGHATENQFHRDAIKGLRRESDKVHDRLAMLLDLRLDRRITQDEYDKKARDLKQHQAEIGLRVAQHEKGDGDFRITLESLISLASRAGELFERSTIEQKRQLIAFVFSNLRLRGKKLEFSLRSPFDLMVNRATYTSWLAFLNTVRTERFEEVLALRPILSTISATEVAREARPTQRRSERAGWSVALIE
jgi:site-specific DNA recombinase